jgi:hypothetical protein
MADDNDTPVGETVDHPEHANPAPEVTPPPVTPPAEAHDDLRDTVNHLSEKVETLTEQVAALLPLEQDSQPVKKPWTHWGVK